MIGLLRKNIALLPGLKGKGIISIVGPTDRDS
jgi:hypothetical protein